MSFILVVCELDNIWNISPNKISTSNIWIDILIFAGQSLKRNIKRLFISKFETLIPQYYTNTQMCVKNYTYLENF